MLNVLHVICMWLHPGHFSLHVADSSQSSEKFVKILNCAFQCHYCHYYYHHLCPIGNQPIRAVLSGVTEFSLSKRTADAVTSVPSKRLLFVGCLTSQQHASVSQGRICSDKSMCCHTEIEVADQTFHLTQSQYIDTGPTSPSTDPVTPGAWQGSHWSANF